MTDARAEEAITRLSRDRLTAHRVLFAHRHGQESPAFHSEIISTWHSTAPDRQRVVTEAFRGGAKSTLLEETFVLRACLREFKNGLLIGASEERAMERLEAVKREIETNEIIAELFGEMRGVVWSGHKIELSNGVVIKAAGRGQSLRGAKHLDYRPDFCGIDDLEDEDTVSTPQQRQKTLRWLYNTLLPALDSAALVRFIGNRLDPEAVIVQVAKDPGWYPQRFPIEHLDPATGLRAASWPAKFSLAWIDAKRDEYRRQGLLLDFNREYMCLAEVETEKPFQHDQIRVRARVQAWEAAWAMFDPARTVNRNSAGTGYACWSYVGQKIVVWDGWQKLLMPNEQIAAMFECDDQYRPVAIGVEQDGLQEWLLQPLRAEQVKRGRALPVRPMKAPDSKLDFIRGMQPFFQAHEVEFAQPLPGLRESLLSFPTGMIDAANALAYMLKMRPGAAIFHEFTTACVTPDLQVIQHLPCWLALNAKAGYSTGILLQHDGTLRIIADWVIEGDPAESAIRIVNNARLEAGTAIRAVAAPGHFEKWSGVGLPAAIGRVPMELRRGGELASGRETVRRLLSTQARGLPAMLVNPVARWTLNGLAGGYARDVTKSGMVADHAAEGAYKVVMEGLETFAALVAVGVSDPEDDGDENFAYTADGRRYRSAMATRRT